MKQFKALAILGTLVVTTAVISTARCAEPAKRNMSAQPDMVKWNLDRLSKDPFKLIKSVPDPRTGQVRFLVEFTRRPELCELFDWEHRGGLVLFRFLDEDGVVLLTVKPGSEGEMVAEKGGRIRVILQMPDLRILDRTRSISVD